MIFLTKFSWLKTFKQIINQFLQDKVINKEADNVLVEVRRKIQETEKMSKLLDAMVRLREARLKKGEKHGYVASSKSSSHFSNVVGKSFIQNNLVSLRYIKKV